MIARDALRAPLVAAIPVLDLLGVLGFGALVALAFAVCEATLRCSSPIACRSSSDRPSPAW